jgi:hypothetical protein
MESIICKYLDKTYRINTYGSDMLNIHTGNVTYYNGLIHDVDMLFDIDIDETRRIIEGWWEKKHIVFICSIKQACVLK